MALDQWTYSMGETSEILGVTIYKVREMVAQGIIKKVPGLGRWVRIHQSEMRRMLLEPEPPVAAPTNGTQQH